ncbi:MAG: ABC transporter ATP-binding protein [Caldilineaceae bacterium]|nr:ABC transporter ATP-binding protein [Caldilineaceae bacterium]
MDPVGNSLLLEMQGITVRYGSVVANDQVNLAAAHGEVVALVGENGAGKTTLMKALVGLVQPQSGTIRMAGRPVAIPSPVAAMQLGIGMVHQHFMLIPPLTVVQNVCIGLRRAGYPFPNLGAMAAEIRSLADRYGLQVDPEARVDQLSVGAQQRVEIVKALVRGADLLVLDEPSAVLTPQETAGLFTVIRRLAEQGKAIIFISHKLSEAVAISRRVVVLRQGRVVAVRRTAETNPEELAHLMVGREVHLPHVEDTADAGDTVVAGGGAPQPLLRVKGLHYTDGRGVERLRGIDLDIRPGEIHGIAGVDGNGQTELAHVLAGLLVPAAGSVALAGREITQASPAQRIAAGVAHIPADRHQVGLVLDLSLADNTVLPVSNRAPFARWGIVDARQVGRYARELVTAYDIRCHSVQQQVGSLSGGNQQKVVLARELSRSPRLILANQPTRGLDVGAIAYIYAMLLEQRRRGSAILLISTELEEILALADRVSVLYEGRIMDTLPRRRASRETLGPLMAGSQPAANREPMVNRL